MSLQFNPFTGSFDFVSKSPWKKLSGSITASSSSVIDTVSQTDLIGAKYIISASNSSETEGKILELNILNLTSSVKDSIFGKINGGLSIDVDVAINASNIEVTITNNEVFDINYNVIKTVFN